MFIICFKASKRQCRLCINIKHVTLSAPWNIEPVYICGIRHDTVNIWLFSHLSKDLTSEAKLNHLGTQYTTNQRDSSPEMKLHIFSAYPCVIHFTVQSCQMPSVPSFDDRSLFLSDMTLGLAFRPSSSRSIFWNTSKVCFSSVGQLRLSAYIRAINKAQPLATATPPRTSVPSITMVVLAGSDAVAPLVTPIFITWLVTSPFCPLPSF